MKNAMKRMLCLLLSCIMVLGMLPFSMAAETVPQTVAEPETITVDFKAFAEAAAEQLWWSSLHAGGGDGTKYLGRYNRNDPVPETEQAAYAAMVEWMKETLNWYLNEDVSGFNSYWKRLYINADDASKVPWGINMYTYYHGTSDQNDQSKLAFVVDAPAEGWYRLDLTSFHQGSSWPQAEATTGKGSSGGDQIALYVNGEEVYYDYALYQGSTKYVTMTDRFGAVYLQRGENDIVVDSIYSYNGISVGGRSNMPLNKMVFTPLDGLFLREGKSSTLKLEETWLAYDAAVSAATHTVTASPEDVVEVSINAEGLLEAKGVGLGEATVMVKKGDEILCAIPARVEAISNDAEESIHIDFKAFAKAASTQSWWQKLAQVQTMDGYELRRVGNNKGNGMTAEQREAYAEMQDYLSGNENWKFRMTAWDKNSSAGERMYLAADDGVAWGMMFNTYYLGYRENVLELEVDAPAAGWYSLNLEIARQDTKDKTYPNDSSMNPGGSYIDVYVNEELLRADHPTSGIGCVEESLGAVYLEEGANSLSIVNAANVFGTDSIRDYDGETVSYVARANVCLQGIEFKPLGKQKVEVGEQAIFDLNGLWLAFDEEVADCAVSVTDEDIADAFIDGDGNVVVEGVCAGETTVTVADVCTIEVVVTEGEAVLGDETITITEDGWYRPKLTLYRNEEGGKVSVYLSEYYLGTVNAYYDSRLAVAETLRPVYLQEGAYELSCEGKAEVRSMKLEAIDAPELTIMGAALSEKQFRTTSTRLAGRWADGMADDLVGARWSVEVCDEEVLSAEITPASVDCEPVLSVTGLLPSNDAWVRVTAEVNGADASVTIPVTVLQPSKLVSMDVELPYIKDGKIARNTTQQLVYTLVGEDGGTIYPHEIEIDYALSKEGIITVDEENHTFRALADGEVTLTATARRGDAVFTKSLDLTVSATGANLFDEETSSFTGGTFGQWTGALEPGDETAFAWMSVEDDGTGNQALKLQTNPKQTTSTGKGDTLTIPSGKYIMVEGGHLYEYSCRVKFDQYAAPEEAVSFLRVMLQQYDYATINGGMSVSQMFATANADYTVIGDWVELKVPIRVPVTYEGPIYLMPRLNVRTNFAADNTLTGWDVTAWFDDFSIREVGFKGIDFAYTTEMLGVEKPGTVVLYPMTTTDSVLRLEPGIASACSTLVSTNEDVVQVKGAAKPHTANGYEYPAYQVQLVGLNAEAELQAEVTIGDVTVKDSTVVAPTDLAEVLRDVHVTLDGFDSLVLKRGQTADAAITGRTTQLNTIEEAAFDSLYFTTSDKSVATVDAYTGQITCVGEGTCVITGYALWEGSAVKDSATLTVDDESDLASIELSANVDYVGVGNTLQIQVSGTKASGGKADMSRYPVAYTISNESLEFVCVSEDGMITGLKAGTATVIATIGVEDKKISDTLLIRVVENNELAGDHISLRFSVGRVLDAQTATLETHGWQINREETYNGAKEMEYDAMGFKFHTPKDEKLVIDFVVKKDGWYHLYTEGKQIYYQAEPCHMFVDDQYMNVIDFDGGRTSNSDAGGDMNTIYLTAGIHKLSVVNYRGAGYIFLGLARFTPVEDPGEVVITMDAGKELLVAGECVSLSVTGRDQNDNPFFLLQQDKKTEIKNTYVLSSSNEEVISVSGTTLTAKAPGTATITLTGDVLGETVTKELTLTVCEGSFLSASATAQETTLLPDAEPEQLTLITYALDGSAQETVPEGVSVLYESKNASVATVSQDGLVTPAGIGSAEVVITLTEGERTVQCSIWITVTEGKNAPTVYTYEERAIAQENALKYDWAWKEKEAAVGRADRFVAHLDDIYEMWIHDTFPRGTQAAFKNSANVRICAYCKLDLFAHFSVYPYTVDPFNKPWKITCPNCKRDFPSNDFASYYESGLGEDGRFHKELADPQYLVNELYPEMGDGWGVDDGWGFFTGRIDSSNDNDECYTFIAYYLGSIYDGLNDEEDSMCTILSSLREAYLYTGDEKYGSAGAILIDRIADIYPGHDTMQYEYSKYPSADGGGGKGKFIGLTWDAIYAVELNKCVDAFWPAMDNPDVIEYLRSRSAWKGMDPEDITPEYVRKNTEDNVVLETFRCAKNGWIEGNFGMSEGAIGYGALCLNRLPESQDMVDWVFREDTRSGSFYNSVVGGGDVMRVLIEEVDRDGFGNEGSYQYNSIMEGYILNVAEALDGFTLVEGADLFQNQKFINMFLAATRFTVGGHLTPNVHESGSVQSTNFLPSVERMTRVFSKCGDRELAKALYAVNGNTTAGLHADIFTKNPESGIRSEIEQIVREDGQWDWAHSEMLSGYGIAMLKEGPATYLGKENAHAYSDFWMGFGHTWISHANLEALKLDLHAFGLNLSSSMGYPTYVNAGSYERMQWDQATPAMNTVVVDDKSQDMMKEPGFPMHFADDGYAKVMDIEAPKAYEMADIYRRTVVAVKAPNGVHYAVDFFRVLGGSEHVYSFHGATTKDAEVTGLDLVKQPFGTYAGADIPYGDYDSKLAEGANINRNYSYSWLDDVYRDAEPETYFTIDWDIEDFNNRLATTAGIHLKLHMVCEEPMTEVALANGYPPRKPVNPDHLEYALIRKSGEPGMDTLFTTILEPYQYDPQIKAVQLVDMVLEEGEESVNARTAAMKVSMINGREDYIIYATEPDCTYMVDGKIRFQGFAGVVSYTDGALTYAWGSEVTIIEDLTAGAVVKETLPAVTGKVLSFTEGLSNDGYFLTVQMDTPVSAGELADRYIYVQTDGIENGAYRIYSAEVNGNTAVLNLNKQTLVRRYVDASNMDLGYFHNIEVGADYSIPLTASFDVAEVLNHTAGTVIRAGNKLNLAVGTGAATYEAEGLAPGMKFDSRAGTITWTTSGSDVGKYPVNVKAVRDGDVIAEMSFVIYVVPYTGSTYAPDKCAHSKTVDFDTEIVCPACGTITKKAADETELFDIAGSNMTLGNELKLNILVEAEKLGEGTYTAKITHNGETIEKTLERYNSAYFYVPYSVSAKQMSDVITAEVYKDGVAVSNVYETSVRTYAMNILNNGKLGLDVKTLVVDMLNYGAEAQKFFSYNTEDLANARLNAAQKDLATDNVECRNLQVKGKNFYGSNVSLEDRIILNLFFKNCEDGMTATVTYTDYNGLAVSVDARLVQYKNDIYKVVVDEIVLADAFSPVTVTVYKDGAEFGSATDSVESYVARNAESKINEAIMKFAYAAKKYLG